MTLSPALALAPLATPCAHECSTAARVAGDGVASVWECDDCGHTRPFTADDYVFVNSCPWTPRAPEGIAPLAWWLMGREAQLAALLAR